MSNKTVISFGGGSISSVGLTGIFVILKLTNVIAWSWLWVLSPLWISMLLGITFALGVVVFLFFCALFVALFGRNL